MKRGLAMQEPWRPPMRRIGARKDDVNELEKFLTECERLDKVATPGTWVIADQNSIGDRYIARADEIGNHFILCELTQFLRDDPVGSAQGNAEFVTRARQALPLLVKMLRQIIETQKTHDMCSGPGPYGAFDPAGIAEWILKETKDA